MVICGQRPRAVSPSTYPGGTQGFIKPSETFVDACQTSPGHVRADFSVHHRDKGLFRADSWGGRGGASPPSPLLLLGSSANLHQPKPHLSLTWIASPPSPWGVPRLAGVHHNWMAVQSSLKASVAVQSRLQDWDPIRAECRRHLPTSNQPKNDCFRSH